MGSYRTTTGERLTTQQIDRKIRVAKTTKIENMVDDQGYISCETCGRSVSVRLDCSHIVSVKEAKESGRAELCFDPNNIKILCRECHQKLDGLDLKFSQL